MRETLAGKCNEDPVLMDPPSVVVFVLVLFHTRATNLMFGITPSFLTFTPLEPTANMGALNNVVTCADGYGDICTFQGMFNPSHYSVWVKGGESH